MANLRIERDAFDAASQVMRQAGDRLGGLKIIVHGDLGGESLRKAADEAASVWANTGRALAEAVIIDGQQLIEVAQAFTRVDEGLAALAADAGGA